MDLGVVVSTLWVLIAAFMVFLMHSGFAMVESGFARTKNVVNVLTKNLATVCVGAIVYFVVGFAIMFGNSAGGFFGTSGFFLSGLSEMDFGIPGMAFWVFQAMFAATCATIVSGAVAERVKFSAYLIFTIVMTAVVYPVVGHWVWGGGWLSELGFHDFAGSTVVHSVGAWGALVFAALLGARIGKFRPDGTVQPIFAHSLPLGALGVFILWFGWFGFNGGSTLDATTPALADIIAVTTLGGAGGGLGAMLFSWLRHGHPDASLTLNGVLAGLVGITAGADVFSLPGGLIAGLIAGVVLVLGVELLDKVLKVDDVVGAIPVHGFCGLWGTLAVGLFATDGGLFYGGGFSLLGVQALGALATLAWVGVSALIALAVIKAIVGLRVSEEVELHGLDLSEHGMIAYGDFMLHSLGDLRRAVNTHAAATRGVNGNGGRVKVGGESVVS